MSNFNPKGTITAAKLNNVGTDLQTLVTTVERNQIREGGLDGSSFEKGTNSPWLGAAPIIQTQISSAQFKSGDAFITFRSEGASIDASASLATMDLHDWFLVEVTGRMDAMHYLDQLNLDGADIPSGLSVFNDFCSTLELQYSLDDFATAGVGVGIPWQVNSLVASGVHTSHKNQITTGAGGLGDKKPGSLYATYSDTGGNFPTMMGPGYSRHFHISALVPRLSFAAATQIHFGVKVDVAVGTGPTSGSADTPGVRVLDTVIRITTLRG